VKITFKTMLFAILCSLILGCGSNPITMEKYDKVEVGMSVSDVNTLVGVNGIERSTTTKSAVPGVSAATTYHVYSWANSDGSTMTVVFQDGKVMSKIQLGLK